MSAVRPSASVFPAIWALPALLSRDGVAGRAARCREGELVMASDTLADALTKIRNASRAKHATVEVPATRLAERVMDVLKQEGFIRGYKVGGETPVTRFLRVYLKYASAQETGRVRTKIPAITQVVRISTPGVRRYSGAQRLPRVLGGLGVAIISTSQGIMSDREAFRKRMGGEVLCYVW